MDNINTYSKMSWQSQPLRKKYVRVKTKYSTFYAPKKFK